MNADRLLQTLLAALATAGCAQDSDSPEPSADAVVRDGGGAGDGSPSDGAAPDARPPDAAPPLAPTDHLDPVFEPAPCDRSFGEGAKSGLCCPEIACLTDVVDACPDPSADFDAEYDLAVRLIPKDYGSGECLCGVDGPYAAAGSPTPGTCCYAVNWQYCTGRPWVVAGVGRVAPAVTRDDWV